MARYRNFYMPFFGIAWIFANDSRLLSFGVRQDARQIDAEMLDLRRGQRSLSSHPGETDDRLEDDIFRFRLQWNKWT